ncbi:DUF2510 domain-containing protein [Nigerium massiliense]|uniref:DUF2510 domain-containing protein n=1 Tax=Nigerium massiliense TaxID=1522317 RepID=UPI00058B1739|nr:DUF2510 domain-containing protein [Nigerium massiliense]
MAQPGWYDDPDGTPGRLRYWDGAGWTAQTAPHPQFSSDDTAADAPPAKRHGWWLWLIAAVLVVLMMVGGGVLTGFVPAPGSQNTTTPTESPAVPDGGVACPSARSRSTIDDGVVQITVPATWDIMRPADWATCGGGRGHAVSPEWMAMALAGTVDVSTDVSPREAAQQLWDWNLQTNYEDLNPQAHLQTDEPVTIGGRQGRRLTGQLLVPGFEFPGDNVEIVVLERPDGRLSAVMTVSTINDPQSTSDVKAIWHSLKVR